jgi:hypothetical protein
MSHLPRSRTIPSSAETRRWRTAAATALVIVGLAAPAAPAQAPASGDLSARIASLSALDFPTRMNAARLVRREPAERAVAALREAVASHPDEYVRYRAFILLTGFNERVTSEMARGLLRDRNDRLREAAYKWLEAHPDVSLADMLLAALQTELAEFVRPALVAALAAVDETQQVQRALLIEVNRGVDFFRSAVIDALGRHRAAYAVEAIAALANLDGPLQDDAILALGRIGGERARSIIVAHMKSPPALMPIVYAASCLAGEPCEGAIKNIVATATASGASPGTVRTALGALSAVAGNGNAGATEALAALTTAPQLVRDEAALGLAAAAVRDPAHMIAWLDAAPEARREAVIQLLKDGFEDLEEDFGKEQFFAAARAAYWAAGEGSASRTLAASLIQTLEF